jgi:hypothetical protein
LPLGERSELRGNGCGYVTFAERSHPLTLPA